MSDIDSLDDYTAPCSRCDRRRYVIAPEDELARAQTCPSCFSSCPACDGEEFVYRRDDRGYRYAVECPVCGTLRERVEAFNQAKIPARYHDRRRATLEYFRTHDPDTEEPIGNLPEIKMRLFRWVRGFEPGDGGFLLHGNVGTGKTHLIVSIVRHLTLEKGIRSRFVEFTHLLSQLKEQFDEGRSEAHVLGSLVDLPVLAVDELGKGQNTNWQLSILDEIISKRYNRNLTTLFTTNFPLDDRNDSTPDQSGAPLTTRATRETLRERIGERIYSRLHEMTEFVHIRAPDFRKHDVSG